MINAIVLAVVLAQGGSLKVTDVHLGSGPKAEAGDSLTMLYKGTLTNGKVFDENFDKGEPFTFILGSGQVIKGWDQGLVGMKAGGERKLVIPASQGYGSQANGPIPANATLLFDVKLVRLDRVEIADIVRGSGKAAQKGDKVGVYYTGTFLNGKKFDSSYDHMQDGKPFLLTLTIGEHRVIPGFEQGVIGMRVGGKRKITIPYELGYGEQTRGPIPGKSTLVFVLEMKSISK